MSFDAMPHAAWPDLAASLTQPWPRAAAEHDLRWHAAEHAIHRRPLPDVRALAERWGWTRTRTHDLLHGAPRVDGKRRPPTWPDMARPWAWAPDKLRTSSGQAPDTGDGQTPNIDDNTDKLRTSSGQAPDSRAILFRSPDHPSPQDPPKAPQGGPECELEPDPTNTAPNGPRLFSASETPTETPIVDPGPAQAAGTLMPWVPRTTGRWPRESVQAMVLLAVEAITQRQVNPAKCKGHAGRICALWTSLGRPDPAELAAELALVAEWARESPDPLAARDICAIGWMGGADRRHEVSTLTTQETWESRLHAAQRWRDKGKPQRAIEARPATAAGWINLQ